MSRKSLVHLGLSLIVALFLWTLSGASPAAAEPNATCTFTATGGVDWGTNAGWTITGAGCPASGTTYPGNTVGNTDNVVIAVGSTVTLDVSPPNPVGTITFNGGAGSNRLTFNPGTTLTSGDITMNGTTVTSGNQATILAVGSGTLSAPSIALIPVAGNYGSNNRRTQITISTGTINVTGNITTPNVTTGSGTGVLFTGAGAINIGGNFMGDAQASFTASTSSINLNGAAQTAGPYTYNNLTLSGSGAKTITGTTVNGILSLQGTATTAGTSPTYGANAVLEYAGSGAQTTSNVEFPAAMSADVTINNALGVTLNAAKTVAGLLTMTNGTLNMANTNLAVGSLTGSGDLTHSSGTAGARTLTIGSDNTSPAAYTGVISNGTATSTSVTKTGTGTLILSGLNSYTGATTISAGTLSINTLQNVSGGTSSLGAPTTTGNGTIAIDATGILQYTGSGHSSNRVINVTNDGGTVDASGSGTFTLSGGVTGSNDNLVLTGTGAGIQSGVIATGAATVTKNGTGTWTLSGLNSYTGITTISAGTLSINTLQNVSGGTSSLGAPTTTGNGTIAIGATGVLQYTGSGHTSNRVINVTADGGTVDASGSGTFTLTGGVTGTGNNLVLTGTGVGVESGVIATAGATLTKNGSGTWTLAGVNTYTGGATLNTGTLNINNANALGTVAGTFTINGGTIDNTSGANITTLSYPLALNGDFAYSGSVPRNLNLGTGTVTPNADRQITVDAGTLTIGGTLSAGTLNLTKAGSGTLSFGANAVTLNNLTISAGSLTGTSGVLSLAGNLNNNGTFTHNNGSVTINGTTTQTISGNVTPFNNLTVNLNAVVVIPSTNIPTVAGTMTNNGTLQQTLNVDNSAPVSFLTISTDKYRGVDIDTTGTGTNLGAVTVTVRSTAVFDCPNVSGVAPIYARRCFDITPTNQGAAAVTLWVLDSELGAIPTGEIVPYRFATGSWGALTGVTRGSGSNNYSYTQGTTPGFSNFLVGQSGFSPTAITLSNAGVISGVSGLWLGLVGLLLLLSAGWWVRGRNA